MVSSKVSLCRNKASGKIFVLNSYQHFASYLEGDKRQFGYACWPFRLFRSKAVLGRMVECCIELLNGSGLHVLGDESTRFTPHQ